MARTKLAPTCGKSAAAKLKQLHGARPLIGMSGRLCVLATRRHVVFKFISCQRSGARACARASRRYPIRDDVTGRGPPPAPPVRPHHGPARSARRPAILGGRSRRSAPPSRPTPSSPSAHTGTQRTLGPGSVRRSAYYDPQTRRSTSRTRSGPPSVSQVRPKADSRSS